MKNRKAYYLNQREIENNNKILEKKILRIKRQCSNKFRKKNEKKPKRQVSNFIIRNRKNV